MTIEISARRSKERSREFNSHSIKEAKRNSRQTAYRICVVEWKCMNNQKRNKFD